MIKFSKFNFVWLLILALALVARLWGITHGLPFVYHPDEPALVRSAYGLRFGNLNPGHFDWPHFHYYLCFLVFEGFIKVRALLQVLHLRPVLESVAPLLWQDPAVFYFLARLLTALMGTATVGLIYFIGKKIFDQKVGLLAALFLALSALHVDQSHYALLDVPLTFWTTLSFFFSVSILEKGLLRDYLLAGLFAGLSASTKYNGALIVISAVAAHILSLPKTAPFGAVLRKSRMLLLSGLAAVGGFLLGTPYALLDWKTFTFKEDARGFLWQLQSMKAHIGAETLNGWWFYLSQALKNGLGVGILVLAVLGVLLALYQHRRKDLLLLSFPVFYFLYVGSWPVVYGRLVMPVLPMLCLLAAGFAFFVVRKLRLPNLFLGIILGLALVQPAKEVAKNDYLLTQADTRTLSKSWIDENIPDKAKIAMDTIYGYFLDPFYLPNLRQTRGAEDKERGFYLLPWSKISEVAPHEDAAQFLADWKKEGVDYLVTSSLVYARYFKEETEAVHPEINEVQADYLWFDGNFKLLQEFSPNGARPGPVIKIYQVK